MNTNNSHSLILLLTEDKFAQAAEVDLKAAGFFSVQEKVDRGWSELSLYDPAMIIFDRALTGQSGLELCRYIRNQGHRLPMLLLVESESVAERVVCIEAGADDYLVKPYQKEKLLEQISLYLQPALDTPEHLKYGNLILDLSTRQILREDRAIDLTMKEFELLKYLMSNPQQVMTREEIIENVWGFDYRGESNVIEVYIRYLRLKLESENNKRLIQTVRGTGYVLREQ